MDAHPDPTPFARIALSGGAWLDHAPTWMTPADADALFAALCDELPWEERAIVVFGREVLQPRLTSWVGELPYRYSGQTLPPRPAPPALAAVIDAVSRAVGVRFNHVVLNRYRDGRDHVSMHADNEPELGRCPTIASLSLGARRRFVLQLKRKRRVRHTYRLRHGSLLVMGGTCQHTWRHAVPKEPGDVGERINVTFRRLLGPPGYRSPDWQVPAR